MFDIIKALFSDEDSPFITVLAVDPHIIIRGIESNLRTSIQDSNVNGFDYLRNAVHLPFYLQSQGMKIQKQELARTPTPGDESPTRNKVKCVINDTRISSACGMVIARKVFIFSKTWIVILMFLNLFTNENVQ